MIKISSSKGPGKTRSVRRSAEINSTFLSVIPRPMSLPAPFQWCGNVCNQFSVLIETHSRTLLNYVCSHRRICVVYGVLGNNTRHPRQSSHSLQFSFTLLSPREFGSWGIYQSPNDARKKQNDIDWISQMDIMLMCLLHVPHINAQIYIMTYTYEL